MKIYKDRLTGERVVEVEDLDFLKNGIRRYSWLYRHYHHFCHKAALSGADRVIAADEDVAKDIVRYYYIPMERITIRNQ